MHIRKKIVIICLMIFIAAGCSIQETVDKQVKSIPDSPSAEEVAALMEYIGFGKSFIESDPGLLKGMEMTPMINESITENGITFTVHQVIADATRTAVIYSFELQKDNKDIASEVLDDNLTGFDLSEFVRISIKGLSGNSTSHGIYNEGEKRRSSIAIFKRIADRDLATITIQSENLGGIQGKWAIEVPVFFMEDIEGRELATYKMLQTENIGIGFTVVELTLGSTATYLDWVLREMSVYEDDIDYTIARNIKSTDENFFPMLSFILFNRNHPEFIVDRQVVYIEDEQGNKITQNYNPSSSTEAFYPPMKEGENLKIVVTGALLQSKVPVDFQIEKGSKGWETTQYIKAGTTVTLDEVIIGDRTSVKLRYQYGKLGEMTEAYILDEQGNRYELENMELYMPAYDDFEEKIEEYNKKVQESNKIDDEEYINYFKDSMSTFTEQYEDYEKYQILHFPSLPSDVDLFTLVFEEILFVLDETWEIRVE